MITPSVARVSRNTAEHVNQEIRRRTEANVARSAQAGPAAIECPENPGGLHLLEGDYLLEVIDPHRALPVKPGTMTDARWRTLFDVASAAKQKAQKIGILDQDDKIVKVTSPLDHPVTHGNLCIKGRFGWKFVQIEPAEVNDNRG